jgi:phage tail-like protein
MLQLDTIANVYHRYPGETVTITARLTASEALRGPATFEMCIPAGLDVESAVSLAGHDGPWRDSETRQMTWRFNRLTRQIAYMVLFWNLPDKLPAGQYEYQVTARAAAVDRLLGVRSNGAGWPPGKNYEPLELKSWSQVVTSAETTESAAITVHVPLQAQSLQYLPGIYHEDGQELLWRYLMAFDSVWDRFDDYLTNLPYYFDHQSAPPDFMRWLADWVGFIWDERLPEEERRRLVPEMIDLYKMRGTRLGLQRYLQLCLDVPDKELAQRIQIGQEPVGNFVLDRVELGDELIMGDPTQDVCKFIVTLADWPDLSEDMRSYLVDVIEQWKPAHTVYELL